MLIALLLASTALAQPEPPDAPPIGEVRITHNYLADLNAEALAIPEGDRAWPIYRDAILALESRPPIFDDDESGARWPPHPGEPGWDEAVAWVGRNADAIALLRRAAAMPAFGCIVTDQPDPILEADRLRRLGGEFTPTPPDPNAASIEVDFTSLGRMRSIARHLIADCRVAVAEGRGERATADLVALMGVASHAAEVDTLTSKLIGQSIAATACGEISEVVRDQARVFSDDQLRQLARAMSEIDEREWIRAGISAERASFESNLSLTTLLNPDLGTSIGLAVNGVASGKAQLIEHNRLIDLALSQLDGEPWRAETYAYDRDSENRDKRWERRFPFVRGYVILYSRVIAGAHQGRASREAVRVAIALERHTRMHGGYPQTLAALVPEFLPAVPIDFFRGESIHYRVVDGRPLLYSIGPDRDDDLGASDVGFQGVKWLNPARIEDRPDGDWILFPPQEED